MRKKDEAKSEIIFEASLDVLMDSGFGGFSMAKVAERANIAVGTIYLYFNNKEDLLNQLYLKLYKESIERFLENYDTTTPFREGLKLVWVNYLMHRINQYQKKPLS